MLTKKIVEYKINSCLDLTTQDACPENVLSPLCRYKCFDRSRTSGNIGAIGLHRSRAAKQARDNQSETIESPKSKNISGDSTLPEHEQHSNKRRKEQAHTFWEAGFALVCWKALAQGSLLCSHKASE